MKKKIFIQKDKCISCGACVSMSPNESIFFDKEGKAEVNPSLANEDDEVVISVCPTEAIILKEYDDES
ncbi:MAG: 4Fe-4S binding protein [Mycoplasmoidaceae bacterium]